MLHASTRDALGKTTGERDPDAAGATRCSETLAHCQRGRHCKSDSTWLCPELDAIKLCHDLDEE